MTTILKLLALTILVGSNTEYWGHTYFVEGNDKVYALRSLNPSSLCTFDGAQLNGKEGIISLASLDLSMAEHTTEGKESCHLTLLPRQVVVSDYTSGTLSLYPLDENGAVTGNADIIRYEGSGAHPKRQKSPHIHSSALSPDGKTLAVVDLGTDRIYCYGVENGRVGEHISTISMPAGCGPRFSVFSLDGRYLYVVTELSDEVMVFDTTDNRLLNRYALNNENPEGGAHIALSSNGQFLYASLRISSTSKANSSKISDGIAVFKCLKNGKLKRIGYIPTGGHPRHFALSPDDKALVVACRDDETVEIFQLDSKTGMPQGVVERYSAVSPVCIGFR